jgi:predicted nucleotidyltransferase
MRLSQKEITAIKKYFQEFFQEGDIYLFGSRVDDSKRGGDIDLYISTPNKKNIYDKKMHFIIHLKRAIGEQKIDVVLDMNQNRLIDKIAKREGVKL